MTVVYAYVCADLIHEGHILHLENAKKLGDKLIVGVLTDEAVMEKKKQPILSFRERLRIIGALRCVDVAVAQHQYSPIENIKAIQPSVIAESTSHQGYSYLEEIPRISTAKMVMLPYYPIQSSTGIKMKIVEEWKQSSMSSSHEVTQ
jgi:D-beta-D-heptose 7-phosphate kinase / D-beta-D-heptose 1-phosphate adenosyltransferase